MECHSPHAFLTRISKRRQWYISLIIVILSTDVTIKAASTRVKSFDYGVIIDAGSSGSRVRVYRWKAHSWIPGSDGEIPPISEIHNYKTNPGISDYVTNLTGLHDHLRTLIEEAKRNIQADKYSTTNIYVLATAGMRLLLEDEANDVIEAIDIFLKTSENPFAYTSLNTRILSGEEEGVFAWITVNYLRGFFNKSTVRTGHAGVVELGGKSAQIAFLHGGSILADKFPVAIGGTIYPLYVHSYLGFGQDSVQAKLQEMVFERQPEIDGQVLNPCRLKDDNITATLDNLQVVEFRGTGNPLTCLDYIDEIVYVTPDEDRCLPKPCAIGTVYQPSINQSMPFLALSAFTYTLRTLGVINGGDGSFSLADTRQAAINFCSKDIFQVEAETDRYSDEFLSTECMMGLYIPVLMEKGFKFSNTSLQVHAIESIMEQPIEWPLGALIYENERQEGDCNCVTETSSALILRPQYLTFIAFSHMVIYFVFLC